ncbi:MAG TPA: hypothetical protein VK983_01100 [Candidatus Limnocylindrales bacterium]|nr:hypothetical protein [Candidatus Limnocylindrales bacterium]
MSEFSEQSTDKVRLLQHLEAANLGVVRPVGDESVAIITRLSAKEEGQDYTGNILRRTCQAVGNAACQSACVRRGSPEYEENTDKLCADRNLGDSLRTMGLQPKDVLMVAVTGDDVGFGDQLEQYQETGKLKVNPEGFGELPGFNAFFARASEVPAIGSRLADCAHLEFEFKDKDGQTVIGFEHGTRPNMKGRDSYSFEVDGRSVSYTEYVLTTALRHYEADPESVRIRLSSSIRAENFVKHFDSQEAIEGHVPGWKSAGFLKNVSNPEWQPGDPVVKEDVWHADARGLILHDIQEAMAACGIPTEQFVCDDMLDPADTNGEFSSYENRHTYGDSRDLYMIAHQTAISQTVKE